MKIVIDSNVLVAAFSSRGLCNSIFELCIDRYTIIISEYIISEVQKVLHKKIKMPLENVELIIQFLREDCSIHDYVKLNAPACRDKNDDDILALALEKDVNYIVTGDNDLLVLKNFGRCKIITPREFWNIVKDKNN